MDALTDSSNIVSQCYQFIVLGLHTHTYANLQWNKGFKPLQLFQNLNQKLRNKIIRT